MNPKDAYAIYTGGGIWLFIGACDTEHHGFQHYLITDEGFALIINADPRENYDDICDPEWQRVHEIMELGDGERMEFNRAVLGILRGYLNENKYEARCGGITFEDIDRYEDTWQYLD